MLDGISRIQSLIKSFQHPILQRMSLVDMEQTLCEYHKFCRQLEVHWGYVDNRKGVPKRFLKDSSPKAPTPKRKRSTQSSMHGQMKGKQHQGKAPVRKKPRQTQPTRNTTTKALPVQISRAHLKRKCCTYGDQVSKGNTQKGKASKRRRQ